MVSPIISASHPIYKEFAMYEYPLSLNCSLSPRHFATWAANFSVLHVVSISKRVAQTRISFIFCCNPVYSKTGHKALLPWTQQDFNPRRWFLCSLLQCLSHPIRHTKAPVPQRIPHSGFYSLFRTGSCHHAGLPIISFLPTSLTGMLTLLGSSQRFGNV